MLYVGSSYIVVIDNSASQYCYFISYNYTLLSDLKILNSLLALSLLNKRGSSNFAHLSLLAPYMSYLAAIPWCIFFCIPRFSLSSASFGVLGSCKMCVLLASFTVLHVLASWPLPGTHEQSPTVEGRSVGRPFPQCRCCIQRQLALWIQKPHPALHIAQKCLLTRVNTPRV